jgi:type IV pilus assembly protein PilB
MLIDLDNYKISNSTIKKINKEMAYKHCVFPFEEDENKIKVVMENTENFDVINDLSFVSKKEIEPFKGNKMQILEYIKLYYEISDGNNAVEDMKKELVKVKEDISLKESKQLSNAPSVRLVDSILLQALNQKASDIHIEPFKSFIKIRIRKDGLLKELMKLPINAYNTIVIRIKIMAKMNIIIKKLPQDGKISYEKDGENYDFRVSSIPTIYGEKIVIRILYKSLSNISIDKLGGKEAEIFREILKYPYGIILVTGPTGSGKSTTMYSMLNELNNKEKNIFTIEDPVEFTIGNVNQINVNNKVGLTFASGLRSLLRQDPDIIFVGEIRDEETAKVAIRAAITGHLVISTLHTNDAVSSILRLVDMGVKPYLVSQALVAAIAQRLVRVICPYCKVSYKPSEIERKILNIDSEYYIYKGMSCHKCNGTGYLGRTAVFEIMKVDEIVKKFIYEGKGLEEIRKHAAAKNMKTLKMSTLDLVKKGITTFDEYVKTVYSSEEVCDELL